MKGSVLSEHRHQHRAHDAPRFDRYVIIANPRAGGGKHRARIEDTIGALKRGLDAEVRVRYTEGPAHATALAQTFSRDEDPSRTALVTMGGDGTTFEALNGIFGGLSEETIRNRAAVSLGVIPVGTGNSMLRDFGIVHAEAAVEAIARGATKPCDLVHAEHEEGTFVYANLLSLGISAEAGEMTNQHFKWMATAGYFVAVLLCLSRHKAESHPYHCIDDQPSPSFCSAPASLLSFSNSRCTGGAMQIAPHAQIADGKLDVVHATAMRPLRLLQSFPRIYKGTHVAQSDVHYHQTAEVRFDTPRRTPLMVDGEILHAALKRLTVISSKLNIFA